MDYIVVSTSKCKYQEWQLRLLDWSRRKTKQTGKLLLLMSDDITHNNDLSLEFDDKDVIVINLPDWAKKWKDEHDDWWGGIPNKYESFNWLAENYPFDPGDTLLFLDPDMIFTEAVDIIPESNQIIGQTWIDYAPIPDWNFKGKAFMYPFVLKAQTLKTIKDDFKEFCFRIRKEVNRWESDMWALFYSAVNNNVSIETLHEFGRCTIWQQPGNKVLTPIIHFPNQVKDVEGNKLFFKQDYTFHPDIEIDISKGKSAIDQSLLLNVTQERTDYIYFLKWNFENIFKNYSGQNGYLYIKPWKGGFNNIRMSLELGVCLAYLTDRTVVLPSSYNMYLLQGEQDFADFFDTNDLGVESISVEEFCDIKGIKCAESEINSISKILDFDIVANVMNFSKVEVPVSFKKWRKTIKSEELFDDSETLFLNGNLLGNFYQSIYTPFENQLKKLIARHVHYRTDIFDLAWRFINVIGDQTYYSIHIRRNDFQYKELFISCEEILENIIDVIPRNSILYIATDHKEKQFFEPLKEIYSLVFYDDIRSQLELDEFNVNWIPIIEQFICTRSIKFVSNKFSTLSSYIFRMRGYMSDIDNCEYYLNTQKFSQSQQCTFRQDSEFVANWSREYKDSWDFTNPKIFVSIASYCDKQLIPTIKDCLKQASNPGNVVIGVHLQDTIEAKKELEDESIENLKIIFTPKDESKGVVWARNKIKNELLEGEDFFLQIDAHSRFKTGWDDILVQQLESFEEPNVVLTTYPNHFEISDDKRVFEKLKNNAPLIVKKFISPNLSDNRLRPTNLNSLKDYEVSDIRWCSAGFVFAPTNWAREIELPDNIVFNGEEDLMTHLSFLKGYNLKLTSETCIWHNYNFKNDKTGEAYKEFNRNEVKDHSLRLINTALFSRRYKRSVKSLENYLNLKFRTVKGYHKIFVSIPSYLDTDILATIENCVSKAKFAQNLTFGVCWQTDFTSKAPEDLLEDIARKIKINIDIQDFRASEGIGWARNKANEFYNEEWFYLQIDAHLRFIDNWDEILIDNYNKLKVISDNPIISYRPPLFYTESNGDIFYEGLEELDKITIPEIIGISEGCFFDYKDVNFKKTSFESRVIPSLDPSFLFTSGDWLRDVGCSDNIYYMGEDVDLSVRSYMAGYDFFTPKQVISWHKAGRIGNKKHYENTPQNIVRNLHNSSTEWLKERIKSEYNQIQKPIRSFRSYEDYSGINFYHQNISQFNGTPQKSSIELRSSKLLRKGQYQILSFADELQKNDLLHMLASAQSYDVFKSLFKITIEKPLDQRANIGSDEYMITNTIKKVSIILENFQVNFRTILWIDNDVRFKDDFIYELSCYKDDFIFPLDFSIFDFGFWQIQCNQTTKEFLESVLKILDMKEDKRSLEQKIESLFKESNSTISKRFLTSEHRLGDWFSRPRSSIQEKEYLNQNRNDIEADNNYEGDESDLFKGLSVSHVETDFIS